ncbi:MAG: glycosyl hydrolase [Acidobacteriota bacterium]
MRFHRLSILVAVSMFPLVLWGPPATAADRGDDDGTKAEAGFDPALFQAMEWRLVGPFRGGRSTAVAGVIQDPFTYYFGGTGGGLWKTTDAGLHWRNVSDGFFSTGSVGAIAVAPSDPNVVYVGMGESPVRGVMTTHGDGVYRSTDGGETWIHLGLASTRHISRVQVDPRDPDTVWVAAQGHLWGPNPERGIYKSVDGGLTWKRVLHVDDDTGASDLALDVTNPRILYAAMWQHRRRPWTIDSGGPGSGLHKSVDGGTTWTPLTKGLPELMGKVGVAVSPANPRRVWAMIEADDGGLFRSDDAGATWTRVNEERVLRARAWYYTHVFAHPTDPDEVWVLNAPAMRSIDGGTTFHRVPTPHGDNHDLWIHPDDPRFMINANDGGANVSWNAGATWTTQSNQPTAQFYRVAADRGFPYKIYGGQQDNSAIALLSRATDDTSLGERHWHDIAGCESAYPAFDPDNPRYVYGGCYQGLIDEWDAETGTTRDVMAYPQLNLSTEPVDMRYRFNWNAPIVVSAHDPQTLYHAANVVLRSRDRGVSWEAISPDLTHDQEELQGPGGGPITSEGAGGEVYGTLAALVESPHTAGVLWAGSDDGRVHRTQSDSVDGVTWTDVTPAALGGPRRNPVEGSAAGEDEASEETPFVEALINAIEISPHDPDTVYLAVTRYKFDDLRPMIFVTQDAGATWRRLDGGLPMNTIVRVVREDPARAGLLYAGTERGVFVSFDGGDAWQPLELGLPTVPVTDLTIRNHDLVAATQGRAFWILDDLTPLHHLNADLAAADLHLFPPRDAHFVGGGTRDGKGPQTAGANPPNGVVVHYLVGSSAEESHAEEPETTDAPESADDDGAPDSETDGNSEADDEADEPALVIEVFDADGSLVRRASSDPEVGDGGPPGGKPLSTETGMQRWVWDLSYQNPAKVPEVALFGARKGPRAGPGLYRIRLSRGERAEERVVRILPDPRTGLTEADYQPRRELMLALRSRLHSVHDAANRLADAKAQVAAILQRLEDRDGAEPIHDAGDALVDTFDELDGLLIQRKATNIQDVINYPTRLDAHLAFLLMLVDGSTPPITRGARDRVTDLDAQWRDLRTRVDTALGADLDAFDALLREHGFQAVIPAQPEPVMPEPVVVEPVVVEPVVVEPVSADPPAAAIEEPAER